MMMMNFDCFTPGDCYRFNGCHGPTCSDGSTPVMTWMIIVTVLKIIVGLPTIFGSARLLFHLHVAKQFQGAIVAATISILFSSTFAIAFTFDTEIRKTFNCDSEGGTDENVHLIAASFVSFFAMFFVVAFLQIVLMWIDVYVKSKTMQKMAANSSILDKYKKVIRGWCVAFVVIFIPAYIISTSAAVGFAQLQVFMFICVWPIGAFNLINILTGGKHSGGNCCSHFCIWFKGSLSMGCRGKPTAERDQMIQAADPSKNEGKFLIARLKMACMVEKTSIRVWLGLIFHFLSALMFVYSKTKEELVVAGEMYLAHFALFGMIYSLMVAEFAMYQ